MHAKYEPFIFYGLANVNFDNRQTDKKQQIWQKQYVHDHPIRGHENAKHQDQNCWRENKSAMFYFVQACCKLKCNSKYVQNIIPYKALISSMYNMYLEYMSCMGKNLYLNIPSN